MDSREKEKNPTLVCVTQNDQLVKIKSREETKKKITKLLSPLFLFNFHTDMLRVLFMCSCIILWKRRNKKSTHTTNFLVFRFGNFEKKKRNLYQDDVTHPQTTKTNESSPSSIRRDTEKKMRINARVFVCCVCPHFSIVKHNRPPLNFVIIIIQPKTKKKGATAKEWEEAQK